MVRTKVEHGEEDASRLEARSMSQPCWTMCVACVVDVAVYRRGRGVGDIVVQRRRQQHRGPSLKEGLEVA